MRTSSSAILGFSLLFLSACTTNVPPAQSPQASSLSVSSFSIQKPSLATSFDPLADAKKVELPWNVRISVPFTVQAPNADWTPTFEEACEEAALLMVEHHLEDDLPFTPETARNELLDLIKWESAKGYGEDVTIDQLAAIARSRFGRTATVYRDDAVTADAIKRLLATGYPVIIPAQGQMLGNPYFSGEGPPYHMLVITGYTPFGNFITNDPGTKHGEGYTYKESVLLNAIHDWTGDKETMQSGKKAMLVLGYNAQSVDVFFYSATDIASANGTPSVPVQRTVEGSQTEQMNNALMDLWEGPSEAEVAHGAHTTDDLRSLKQWYTGVRFARGIAYVSFQHDALSILNSAAARQGMVKAPIEKTLLQFQGIEKVEYEINGKVFTEWDA